MTRDVENLPPIDEDMSLKVEDLPDNVNSMEQVELLPPHYRSDDPKQTRPLVLHDEDGITKYHYSLKPMLYGVIFILIVECLERFSYYGVNFTQTAFLTGEYNHDWNANMTSVEAAQATSLSSAIAYCAPFFGAILADSFMGDFNLIAMGTLLFYIPGIVLIALTTIPGLLGDTFNTAVLKAGLFVLYPLGAGCIKSVVNTFGAKQFHPLLQSAMIETYYVNFYMFINIGALVGGISIPIIAQKDVTVAYFIPAGTMALALFTFFLGSGRYVKMRPNGKSLADTGRVLGSSVLNYSKCKGKGMEHTKASQGGKFSDHFVQGVKQLFYVFPITSLVIPFNIVYAQMTTTFIIQGTVMESVSVIDASMMQNADAISVLAFGALVGQFFYPTLAKCGIRLRTTQKFALGSACATLSIACAILVEYQIRAVYAETGKPISVLWQAFSYACIGAGEIFASSSAYEAAFLVAPKSQKALASAINLFLIGGLPNFISMALDDWMKAWFTDPSTGSSHITTLEAYTRTELPKFWWVVLCISLSGVVINLLPPIVRWVDQVEKAAQESILESEKKRSSNDSKASQEDEGNTVIEMGS